MVSELLEKISYTHLSNHDILYTVASNGLYRHLSVKGWYLPSLPQRTSSCVIAVIWSAENNEASKSCCSLTLREDLIQLK